MNEKVIYRGAPGQKSLKTPALGRPMSNMSSPQYSMSLQHIECICRLREEKLTHRSNNVAEHCYGIRPPLITRKVRDEDRDDITTQFLFACFQTNCTVILSGYARLL